MDELDTFQAVAVTLLAVLPGALYTWSFEREVGNWGVSLSDRVLRFVGFSALFHAVLLFPEYLIWSHYIHKPTSTGSYRNLVATGDELPWWLFLAPIVYVGVPMAVGFFTARGVFQGRRWPRLLVGPNPQPRAWDRLFWSSPAFLVRLRLKNDSWVGGLFGANSYAAGYPEPQDLLLETTYRMDGDGAFAQGSDGGLQDLGSGILVAWEDVHFLEVFQLGETEEETDG
jgi:hypothetical protein